jgi:hypothetical protein
MSPLSRTLLISAIALSLPELASAQPKADAGSGPTSGATSANDAGSGPTKGAEPNVGSSASNSRPDVTPGPKSTGGSQPATPATTHKKQ